MQKTDAYRPVIDSQNQKAMQRQALIDANEQKYRQQLAEKAKQEQLIKQAMADEQHHVIQLQLNEQKMKRKQEAEHKRIETE